MFNKFQMILTIRQVWETLLMDIKSLLRNSGDGINALITPSRIRPLFSHESLGFLLLMIMAKYVIQIHLCSDGGFLPVIFHLKQGGRGEGGE